MRNPADETGSNGVPLNALTGPSSAMNTLTLPSLPLKGNYLGSFFLLCGKVRNVSWGNLVPLFSMFEANRSVPDRSLCEAAHAELMHASSYIKRACIATYRKYEVALAQIHPEYQMEFYNNYLQTICCKRSLFHLSPPPTFSSKDFLFVCCTNSYISKVITS